jgi:glycosyltransferase involved in cell wall biosynthesis
VKIAINTRWLLPGRREGIGWYTYHIVKRLINELPHADFHLMYDRKIKTPLIAGVNVTNHVVYPQARHPLLWTFWNEITVPAALGRIRPDVYFSPDGFLPKRGNYAKIVSIHDLNFEEGSAFLQPNAQHYYQKYIRAAAVRADHIFTVSDYSKKDIEKHYNIPAKKVSFAHNGPQQEYSDLHSDGHRTKERYAQSQPYFLFVGAQNPRKNLHRIFQAFDAFCQVVETGQTPYKLVLVGEKMLWNEEINFAWKNMRHQDRVIFTGRLTTNELNKVYSAATALVFPSLFEGFGMPIIEAFASGCPVITSHSSSMPEVAGNAALLVDPIQHEEITRAMLTIANDEALRKQLRQRGFARAKVFNWDAATAMIAAKMKELARA